jgi:Phospholipase_D-nuclease N-terminal
VYAVIGAFTFVMVLAALIDIITRDPLLVRHLPKVTWVILVIVLPVIGSIIWFAVGHDWGERREAIPFGDPRRQDAAVRRMRAEYVVDEAAVEAELRLSEKQARIRRLEEQLEAKRRERGESA